MVSSMVAKIVRRYWAINRK